MELFTLDNLFTLLMLIALQAVLGFDNLLYISLESKRAPAPRQRFVRQMGIGIAVLLRIALLFVLVQLIELFQDPWFSLAWEGVISATFNLHAFIVLIGGAFILYTATKEVWHMISLEEHADQASSPKSVGLVVTSIVVMNAIFSIDSILSAMALTDVFVVMATAIVIGGLLMIYLADRVADFLAKNRLYEVLGLFILFVVGIMLVTEGGHLAQMTLFGEEIHAMTKTTFYFVIVVLVATDLVQGRYQRKLIKEKAKRQAAAKAAANA